MLEERADLSDARATIMDGRLSVSANHFDDASRQFAAARAMVEGVQIHVRETGQAERAGQLAIVLAELKDAERLSNALDASAQTPAERAVQALRSLTPGAK